MKREVKFGDIIYFVRKGPAESTCIFRLIVVYITDINIYAYGGALPSKTYDYPPSPQLHVIQKYRDYVCYNKEEVIQCFDKEKVNLKTEFLQNTNAVITFFQNELKHGASAKRKKPKKTNQYRQNFVFRCNSNKLNYKYKLRKLLIDSRNLTKIDFTPKWKEKIIAHIMLMRLQINQFFVGRKLQ